jgi:hypothetical protein
MTHHRIQNQWPSYDKILPDRPKFSGREDQAFTSRGLVSFRIYLVVRILTILFDGIGYIDFGEILCFVLIHFLALKYKDIIGDRDNSGYNSNLPACRRESQLQTILLHFQSSYTFHCHRLS